MTEQEKARAYDKALKIAQCWLNAPQIIQECNYTIEDAIQSIFPQLKNSEDERIIEEIKFAVMQMPSSRQDTKNRCLAWLEKQKEQSEEPKIAFGDWRDKEKKEAIITCLKYMRFIKKITNQEYDDLTKWLDSNLVCNLEIPEGDVTPEEDGSFNEDKFLERELSAFLQNYDKEYDDDAAVSDVARHFYEIGKKQKEQKPVDDKAFEEWIDGWWKEHKEKAYPQITMDEKEFKNFCRGIRNMYAEQKSVPISCSHENGTPAEWSEEDEKMFQESLTDIIYAKNELNKKECKGLAKSALDAFNWLNTRFKYLRPSWKPSEEQMEEL